jgi:hypothetical protein
MIKSSPETTVKDPVTMWAVRKIGQNIPFTLPTLFMDEAERQQGPETELVKVTIEPAPVEGQSCNRCGSPLQSDGYCSDMTCPYSDYLQLEEFTEA